MSEINKKCLGIGCQKKEQCKRYTSTGKNEQNFVDFYQGIGFDGRCYNFCSTTGGNVRSMYVR